MADQTATNLTVTTCLWFEKQGLEAARFYVSLIPNSRMITDLGPNDSTFIVDFELAGVPYRIMNAGPMYKLSPACSISVTVQTQAEVDRLWDALIRDGGAESRCGWLVDAWGVSWQIIPAALAGLLGAPDRAAAGRAQAAMMGMTKIDIGVMQAAFERRS